MLFGKVEVFGDVFWVNEGVSGCYFGEYRCLMMSFDEWG